MFADLLQSSHRQIYIVITRPLQTLTYLQNFTINVYKKPTLFNIPTNTVFIGFVY